MNSYWLFSTVSFGDSWKAQSGWFVQDLKSCHLIASQRHGGYYSGTLNVKHGCWSQMLHHKLRKACSSAESSSSSISISTSPPLWAAVFFLFTCRWVEPQGLCMGTSRRKPGEADTDAEDRLTGERWQGTREEDEEAVEGLLLWTEEYPELWRLMRSGRLEEKEEQEAAGSPIPSSSLERALQCSTSAVCTHSGSWTEKTETENKHKKKFSISHNSRKF